jgi:hypothetical protein
VSIARLFYPSVMGNCLLQLPDPARLRTFGEYGAMNVLRRISTRLADDNSFAFLLPLEHRARSDPELAANFRGDCYQPSSCDLRLRQSRGEILRRYFDAMSGRLSMWSIHQDQ